MSERESVCVCVCVCVFSPKGESYGGVYVPLLASKVLRHNREAPAELRLNLQVCDSSTNARVKPTTAHTSAFSETRTKADGQ